MRQVHAVDGAAQAWSRAKALPHPHAQTGRARIRRCRARGDEIGVWAVWPRSMRCLPRNDNFWHRCQELGCCQGVGVADVTAAGALGPGLPESTPAGQAGGPGHASMTREMTGAGTNRRITRPDGGGGQRAGSGTPNRSLRQTGRALRLSEVQRPSRPPCC
jgi:hypothetical protein